MVRWVAYLEMRGLYAAAHRGQPAARPGRAPLPVALAPGRPAPAGGPAPLGGPNQAVAAGVAEGPDRPPLLVVRDGRLWDGCPRVWNQGARVGMPRRQALRQVPGAAVALYGEVDYTPLARALWDRLAGFSGWVEPVSEHQAFVDLSGPSGQPPRQELASLVRAAAAAVAAAAGVPPAELFPLAGLGTNKLVARAAALTAGPGRPAVVPRGEEAAFLAPLPVEALWRAPGELRERIARLGLRRIGDLARVPAAELRRQFGPWGEALARWSRGEDPEPVAAAWPPRTIRRRIAFPEGAAPAALAAAPAALARELAAELAARAEVARAVALEVEWEEGADRAEQRLPRRAWFAASLELPLQVLLRQLLARGPRGSRVLALTASAGDLLPAGHRQLDLWGLDREREAERQERLDRALGVLQARFPARRVQVGWPEQALGWRQALYGYYDPHRWAHRSS